MVQCERKSHTHPHALTRTHTQKLSHSHTHTLSLSFFLSLSLSLSLSRARSLSHTHTHINTRTHTRKHTHTHSHTGSDGARRHNARGRSSIARTGRLKKKKICSLFSLLHTRTIVLTLEKLKWTHRMQPRRMFGRCSVYYVQKLWIKSISMSCNLLHTTSIENIYRAQERRQEGRKVRKRGGKKERKKEREEERKRGRKKERKKEREEERKRGWKKERMKESWFLEPSPHRSRAACSSDTYFSLYSRTVLEFTACNLALKFTTYPTCWQYRIETNFERLYQPCRIQQRPMSARSSIYYI